jgi:hypothetical protein
MTQLLVNLGYILMLLALLVRDILWLRSILMSAQIILFAYGIVSVNYSVAFWNILFFAINGFQVSRLIRERRPIELPSEITDLYENIFSSMRRREFLNLWHMGSIDSDENEQLIKKGRKQKKLYLILSGKVRVENKGTLITKLGRGSFLAEMSFLTGNPATADVIADGKVRYIFWEQQKLNDLQKINADLFIKLQNILGKDLTEKVKAVTEKQVQDK